MLQQLLALSPNEAKLLDTDQLRQHFLIENVFQPDGINFTYCYYDRIMLGGAMPIEKTLTLPNYPELKANFFLERRELGIINIGGNAVIKAANEVYNLEKLDALYIGKGTATVEFSSEDAKNPAKLYFLSSPAHQIYPVQLCKKAAASPIELGALETSNQRTVYKYIHQEGIKSCQLVMGLTILKLGSVWNTMPAHTHDRRTEVYLYFDLAEDQRVVHFMGTPQETRHILAANEAALLSPPWSIHSGCGTSNYAFVWGMCGENLDYSDMDKVEIAQLK